MKFETMHYGLEIILESLRFWPNRPYSYSLYRTGTSLQWRLLRGISMSFAFENTLRISLNCKLVPVQYLEYEYGLLIPSCSPV